LPFTGSSHRWDNSRFALLHAAEFWNDRAAGFSQRGSPNMVERLRQSVEELEPPVCADCSVEMEWYRSILVSGSEPLTVAHFFQCPNCSRLQEIKKPVRTIRQAIGGTRLSKPANDFVCAA
jgi:hypothetical protein